MEQAETRVAAQSWVKATLFGDFRIDTPSGELVVLSNRRAALLLAVLCLEPDHAIDREALARLLWPDRFLAQAKASLRQCLLDLRRKLEDHGIDCLIVSRGEVALVPGSLRCDLFDLEAGLLSDDPAAAISALLAIGNRPLIQGPPLNPEFDEWITTRRDHVDAQLRAAISAAIRNAPKAASERLLEAARARFPTYRTFNRAAHQARIAILPFGQIDSVGGNFFLADGIVDELSTRLAGINGIALAGRTSVAAVIDKGRTLTEIASELGVDYVIEGEVRREAQGIGVRIALISGQSGTEVWSDRLSGSIEDFFDGRKVIGANVIAAICRALGLTAAPAPSRKMTHDREAYALYLQARAMIQKIAVEGAFAKASHFLNKRSKSIPNLPNAGPRSPMRTS